MRLSRLELLRLPSTASGDLRHMIYTVNSLPKDYSGDLTFLINDADPHIVLRNTILLQTLGCIEDKAKAVDIALHTWYSAFLPEDYYAQISKLAITLKDHKQSFQLGPNATLDAAALFQLSRHSQLFVSLCHLHHVGSDRGVAMKELDYIRYVFASLCELIIS